MGINGLLPLMKGAETQISLSKLQDTIAAIDTNGWIHRACYSCADRIYLGEPTEMYIHYCLNFCKLLQKYRITPILVFDGQSLPAKSETKLSRQKRKQKVREDIEELLRTGQERQARWLMRQCVDVTFEMCRRVIERCRQEHIDCLVAPFEADAQITFLVNNKLADYAITEDSDLLAFGCHRVLYKLDREAERGLLVDLNRLSRCFPNLDLRRFQYMCILSGCDYVQNIPGIGIGRSKKFFETITENPNIENISKILHQLPTALNIKNGKIKITTNYIENFIRASNTFDHQIVYSPQIDDLTYLNPLKRNVDPEKLKEYAGDFFQIPNSDYQNSCSNNLKFVTNYILGNVCPKTLKFIDSYDPSEVFMETQSNTIWFSSNFNERIKSSLKGNLEYLHNNNSKQVEDEKFIHFNHDKNVPTSTIQPSMVKLKDPQTKKPSGGSKGLIRPNKASFVKRSQDSSGDFETRKIICQVKRQQFTILRDSKYSDLSLSNQCRYTRNMFCKQISSSIKTKSIDGYSEKMTKSKYFNQGTKNIENDDFDENEFQDLFPITKKSKQTSDKLNTSASSIDEETELLHMLNGSQQEAQVASSGLSFQRCDSLSSTQTNSQSSTTSSLYSEFQLTNINSNSNNSIHDPIL